MTTQIQVTIFEDAEKWIIDNVPDMGIDAVASVYPVEPINVETLKGSILFVNDNDSDDPTERRVKRLNMHDLVKGLQLLAKEIGDKKLFVGGIKSPTELMDAGNWDVEVVDAYFQLCMLGEVIYG